MCCSRFLHWHLGLLGAGETRCCLVTAPKFWNAPGGVGNVIVARACFSQVYPGAQADNPGVLTTPGLKGKPVGGWSAPRTQEAMR